MTQKRLIPLVLIFAVGVSGATTGVTQLTRQDRTRIETVLRSVDRQAVRIPTLQRGLSKEEQADAVTELEIGFRRMKRELPRDRSARVPVEVHEGIRVWESLPRPEREALMRGEAHSARAWTPAAMFALAAAKFIYDVGKDHCWWGQKDSVVTRPPTKTELDAVESSRPTPHAMRHPEPGRAGTAFEDRTLNYQ